MSLRERLGLLRGLLSGEFAYAGPFAVTVDVTRSCNLRCAGCGAHSARIESPRARASSGQDLDPELLAGLCRELRQTGTRRLIFCGEREPLLHPRLLDLVRLAKAATFHTALLTNGTLLNEVSARALVETGLDTLRVSLWGSTPASYTNNSPGTDARWFHATVRGLELVRSERKLCGSATPRGILHVVFSNLNWREVEGFVDLAIEAGVDAVSFSPLHTLSGKVSSLALDRKQGSAVGSSLLKGARRLQRAGIEHNVEETIRRYGIGEEVRRHVPCYIGWTHPRIAVDGTAFPCGPCDRPLGGLSDQGFREIWNGDRYREFRRTLVDAGSAEVLDRDCDCSFCCHVRDHARIQRAYRWVAPVAPLFRNYHAQSAKE